MRFLYQQKAEPIELLVNPPSAQPLENWEPHAEVPRFRTKGENWQRSISQDSGYANPAGWVLPVTVQGVSWLTQNTLPQRLHTARKFHPSLYPNAAPIWINTRVIRPLSIAGTASVGKPSLIRVTSTAVMSGTVNTDATGLSFTWQSGEPLTDSMVGRTISINGVPAIIKAVGKPSTGAASPFTDTFAGDPLSGGSYITTYILTAKPIVKVDGVEQDVTELGVWDVPYNWYWIPGGYGVFQKFGDTPLTALQTLTVIYASTLVSAVTPGLAGAGYQISVPSDMHLYIGGVERYHLVNTLRIENSIGGRGSCSFTVFSEAGTYRPTEMETVTFYNRGVRRFGGFVQRVVDEVIEGNDATEVAIQCVGNRGFADRAVVSKRYTADIGGSIWVIFNDIWYNKLRQFGVTYVYEGDPGVVLEDVDFHYITVTECYDRLIAKAPGWAWWIDENNQLHLKQTATGASFPLTDTSRNWERMQVTLEAGMYRNKQWVVPSGPIAAQQVDSFTGDGQTIGFVTDYILTAKPVVKVNGVEQNVTSIGAWGVAYDWYYNPNGAGVFQKLGNTPLTAGQTLTVTYSNPLALATSAQDDAEITLRGLVEAVEHAKDIETVEEAQALADGLLEAFSGNGIPEIVEYDTNEQIEPNWPEVGTLQGIDVAHPATSGNKTVESVSSELLDLTLWKHKVRARKGNFNADYQTILETLTKAARNNRDRHIAIGEVVLAETIIGLTNPGLATGLVTPSIILEKDCVFDRWSIFPMSAADTPTGAGIIVDALLDGVTLLPSGSRIVLPGGQTTEATGRLFSSSNLLGAKGQVITFNVIQVGSVGKGKDIKVRIVMLVR